MLTLRVDSTLIPGVNVPITVDAVLSAVEPVLAQGKRIVTAVRINGVDEPAFRESGVLERVLHDADALDVDTTPAGEMAASALGDALRYLPELSQEARGLATTLRGASAQEAGPQLAPLADNLALLAALVHTADLWARQAGLAPTDWLGDDVAEIDRVAAVLTGAAESADWVAVADALEHDLTTALASWQVRLAEGRAQLHALQSAPVA
ncbi:hypothetical protein TBR22_A27280 [Luteitalea sp. TBR-22]|uniref:hypothetical protein n=1 Tax=Luteitalea sp. TBR-22 TaxID=2802971 RepID=UPI001AF18543|nr:hypothetical protein [Luteitalea sp. TBR-22]BCS33501.1 hypothetical protein TBR22_A27280 [Luteitalea sp. TBR-22]